MRPRSNFRKETKYGTNRERRLSRGARRAAAIAKHNKRSEVWCYHCKHEITGKLHEHTQCHNCHTWNHIVNGQGYPAQFEDEVNTI